MQVSPLQRAVKASDLPLDKVAASSTLSESEKIAAASRAFEGILLRQVLAEAQKPVFKSNLMGSSTSASIYQDMVTNQLAESISKSGALGLGKTLERHLNHQTSSRSGHTVHQGPATPTTRALETRHGALHFPNPSTTETPGLAVKSPSSKPTSPTGPLVSSPTQARFHPRTLKHE